MRETLVTKTRRPKKTNKFIVGKWKMIDGAKAFVPSDVQPDAAVTDINQMVAWTKVNLGSEPGTYEFVREVPGALQIAQQLNLKFTFA